MSYDNRKINFKFLYTNKNMNAYKLASETLIEKNGSTTTLEVKNYLREVFPSTKWTQGNVSTALSDLADENYLTFTDAGEYRVYTFAAQVNKLAKTALADKLITCVGKTITAEFNTKNHANRVVTGTIMGHNSLGIITIDEDNVGIRSFKLDRLHWFKIGNIRYEKK